MLIWIWMSIQWQWSSGFVVWNWLDGFFCSHFLPVDAVLIVWFKEPRSRIRSLIAQRSMYLWYWMWIVTGRSIRCISNGDFSCREVDVTQHPTHSVKWIIDSGFAKGSSVFCVMAEKRGRKRRREKAKHLTRFSCSAAFLFFGGQQVSKFLKQYWSDGFVYMFAISLDFWCK